MSRMTRVCNLGRGVTLKRRHACAYQTSNGSNTHTAPSPPSRRWASCQYLARQAGPTRTSVMRLVRALPASSLHLRRARRYPALEVALVSTRPAQVALVSTRPAPLIRRAQVK